MAVALFVAGVTFANAEDYNRVAVSFDFSVWDSLV